MGEMRNSGHAVCNVREWNVIKADKMKYSIVVASLGH